LIDRVHCNQDAVAKAGDSFMSPLQKQIAENAESTEIFFKKGNYSGFLTPPPPPAAGGKAAGGGVRLNRYQKSSALRSLRLRTFLQWSHL
jgi:hypothetical protein